MKVVNEFSCFMDTLYHNHTIALYDLMETVFID